MRMYAIVSIAIHFVDDDYCMIQNPEVGDGFCNSVGTYETNYVSSV
jgi:hypothetical protein